jgi:aldehyde dehydrogenase (NAD+)
MAGTTLIETVTADQPTPAVILERLGIRGISQGACGKQWLTCSGPELQSYSPRDESLLGVVQTAALADYEQVIADAQEVFTRWRMLPAPQRGLIVRAVGDELRKHLDDLGTLVT